MIHLIYRHTDYIHNCGRGKNRPYYFSYDNCLNNILSTIENIDFIKFHLVHDGVNNSIDPRIHFIQNIEGKSEYKSWGEALKYAKTLDLKDDDLIIFMLKDGLIKLKNLLKLIMIFHILLYMIILISIIKEIILIYQPTYYQLKPIIGV